MENKHLVSERKTSLAKEREHKKENIVTIINTLFTFGARRIKVDRRGGGEQSSGTQNDILNDFIKLSSNDK